MAKRGNANFDLARLQQLRKTALHPFDRHRLTNQRAPRGHDHAVALHAQNGVRPTGDSRDRLSDKRFKKGAGSRLNRHSSDYRLLLMKTGEGAQSCTCGLAVSRVVHLLACGHIAEQLRGRGRREGGGTQQGEGLGVAANVGRAVQEDAAVWTGQMDHA
jgi:hypothetical protein